jgi:phage terminase large subunit-like protein
VPRVARAQATLPRPELQGLDLYDLISSPVGLSPDLMRPTHMGPIVDAFQSLRPGVNRKERRARKGRRIVMAAPVQHGKSTIEQHFIVSCLLDDPGYRIALCGYGKDFVNPQSKTTREIARTAGVQFKDDMDTIFQWGTPDGGFAMFTTVAGTLTGFGFDCILIDDPFKDREEAESLEVREKVWIWYTQTVLPRVAPWTDIIVLASRWHVDDLSGRLLSRGVEKVHLKAIQDDGTALWPEVRPLEFLLDQRKFMGNYAFESNFQGMPYIDGDTSFGEPARYNEIPSYPGFKYVVGFDLAYSQSRRSDYFAYCVLKIYGSEAYVVDLKRTKADLKTLATILGAESRKYGHCPCVSYISGPELAAIHYLANEGVRVTYMHAKSNKRFRSQRSLDQWRRGRVLMPFTGLEESEGRIMAFRGNETDQSDEVDALVSGLDFGMGQGVTPPRMVGGRKAYSGMLG